MAFLGLNGLFGNLLRRQRLFARHNLNFPTRQRFDNAHLFEMIYHPLYPGFRKMRLFAQLFDLNGATTLLNRFGHLLHLLFLEMATAGEETGQPYIFRIVEQNRFCLCPITPGATNFLIVGIDRLTDVVVEDETHIGFIDAHAKSGCGDDDRKLVIHELFLHALAFAGPHTRMIGRCFDAALAQGFSNFFSVPARPGIDDTGLHRLLHPFE